MNWVKGLFCQKISPIYKFGKLFLSSLILKIKFLLPASFILNFEIIIAAKFEPCVVEVIAKDHTETCCNAA